MKTLDLKKVAEKIVNSGGSRKMLMSSKDFCEVSKNRDERFWAVHSSFWEGGEKFVMVCPYIMLKILSPRPRRVVNMDPFQVIVKYLSQTPWN
jgi:hypothetical protein